MLQTRAIPVLLLKDAGLVKTTKFRSPKYLGDPINIVRIFNDKQVDELLFLDIAATVEGRSPPFDLLAQIASEAFVPFGYGGGVRTIEDMRRLYSIGIEKIAINSHAAERPDFVREAAESFGAQSVVVSIDVRKKLFGRYQVASHGGRRATGREPVEYAQEMEDQGAGEIFLTAIDRDGSMTGYDLNLVRSVTAAVSIPVVASGGAGSLQDLGQVVRRGGASAAAAGSLFVFQGPHRAVLINYPTVEELRATFREQSDF